MSSLECTVRRLPLDDGLRVCLALLEDEPERFDPVVAVWHARWCMHLPRLRLTGAVVALDALQALGGPGAAAAARSLRTLSALHGLEDVAEVLDRWLIEHEARETPMTMVPAGGGES